MLPRHVPPRRTGRDPFDADAAELAQLRRRLLADAGPPGTSPTRRRADELLARLRRVGPCPLLIDGRDADAALLLDAAGLAELTPHARRDLLVLRLDASDGATGRGGRGRG